jgi:hypothetical protein
MFSIKEIPCATRGDNLGFILNLVYFWGRPLGYFVRANGGGKCGVGIF